MNTTDRQTGIGASEAAAAIGANPPGWKGPFRLWAEKTGQVEPENLDDVERVQWGKYLQPEITRRYAERTGRTVRQNRADVSRRSHTYPWMFATPDATQRINGGPLGVFDAKNTNTFADADWREEAPLYCQVQIVHQMIVCRYPWGSLAALIGGQKAATCDFVMEGSDVPGLDNPVVVTERFTRLLIKAESAFWQLVQSKTPPPVDGSADTADALKRLYGVENGTSVELPAEAAGWDAVLREAKANIKKDEAIKLEFENKLKGAIGAATFGVLPDGSRYQWKERKREDPAREARTIRYRELRRLKK